MIKAKKEIGFIFVAVFFMAGFLLNNIYAADTQADENTVTIPEVTPPDTSELNNPSRFENPAPAVIPETEPTPAPLPISPVSPAENVPLAPMENIPLLPDIVTDQKPQNSAEATVQLTAAASLLPLDPLIESTVDSAIKEAYPNFMISALGLPGVSTLTKKDEPLWQPQSAQKMYNLKHAGKTPDLDEALINYMIDDGKSNLSAAKNIKTSANDTSEEDIIKSTDISALGLTKDSPYRNRVE